MYLVWKFGWNLANLVTDIISTVLMLHTQNLLYETVKLNKATSKTTQNELLECTLDDCMSSTLNRDPLIIHQILANTISLV